MSTLGGRGPWGQQMPLPDALLPLLFPEDNSILLVLWKEQVNSFSYFSQKDRCAGIIKATLRFANSLEGLTALRRAIIFMLMVYYSENTDKLSKEKRHIGPNPEESRASIWQSSSCEFHR